MHSMAWVCHLMKSSHPGPVAWATHHYGLGPTFMEQYIILVLGHGCLTWDHRGSLQGLAPGSCTCMTQDQLWGMHLYTTTLYQDLPESRSGAPDIMNVIVCCGSKRGHDVCQPLPPSELGNAVVRSAKSGIARQDYYEPFPVGVPP